MALTIKVRKADRVIVLEMSGRLVFGEPVEDLRDAMRRLLDEGYPSFLLNLSGVSHMDSTGLGYLVAAYASAKNRRRHVALLSPSPRVGEILKIAKIAKVFDIYNDEAEAIEALTKRGAAAGGSAS